MRKEKKGRGGKKKTGQRRDDTTDNAAVFSLTLIASPAPDSLTIRRKEEGGGKGKLIYAVQSRSPICPSSRILHVSRGEERRGKKATKLACRGRYFWPVPAASNMKKKKEEERGRRGGQKEIAPSALRILSDTVAPGVTPSF